MRLFVAVWPSAPAIAGLASAVAALHVDGVPPRWLPDNRWHVTLAFLGEVDEATVPRLRAGLSRAAARRAPTELQLTGAGRFGRSVLWVGVAGDVAPLTELATRAAAAARHTGIEIEDRRFHPHLTVARGRPGADLRPWAKALASYVGPPWPMDRVSLARSTLGPPPAYTEVQSWPITHH
ncbi:RNA 2',3'-cyclic phosphodiesterase [Mycobacterium sp.]|uniref:RNA 2',3'-cyclic phosphodiesterase n=1 Tax=Mycobacterium sp. TaxID=1785 RepID=UPI003F7F2EF0